MAIIQIIFIEFKPFNTVSTAYVYFAFAGVISFQRVNPNIRLPPTACHKVIFSPNMVTETITATNGIHFPKSHTTGHHHIRNQNKNS